MNKILIYSLLLLTLSCQSQNSNLKDRSIDYYFEKIGELEFEELKRRGVLLDTTTIAEEFLDKQTQSLNEKGFMQYGEVKMNIYKKFFKDYLFLQKIEHKSSVYVLYFSVAGYDDIEWHVVKWAKSKWDNSEKLSEKKIESQEFINEIFWNYDEGPKNMEGVKIFKSNKYLVLERSGLFHSLYDMETAELIMNEESPWHASNGENAEKMNEWIKLNLHDKIEEILNK